MTKKTVTAIAVLLLSVCCATGLFAQANGITQPVGEPDPENVGTDTAQQMLREVSVTKFEDSGFWDSFMPSDQGLITHRSFVGEPADKEPIEGEEEAGIEEQDRNVLGVKVDYFKRGKNTFSIAPARPIPIEGITKTISVWVVGRNYKHMLKLIILDYFGQRHELTVGKLNFTGWKRLTVAVPPTITQDDYHYHNRMGIKVAGFIVECDLAETFGQYYIYFDDMRAVTDLFAEESRDVDDMVDTW